MKAHDLIGRSSGLSWERAWGCLFTILALARSYQTSTADAGLVHVDPSSGVLWVHRWVSRFTEGYYSPVIKRLRRLPFEKGRLITLTVDPKRFHSMQEAIDALYASRGKLVDAMKRAGPSDVIGWTGEFFWSLEFTKSNLPHLHLIVFGDVFISWGWLQKVTQRYRVGNPDLAPRQLTGRYALVNYGMKYLAKQRSESALAIGWATGKHAYGMSRGLLVQVQNVSTPFSLESRIEESRRDWVLIGVFSFMDCAKWRSIDDIPWKLILLDDG